MTQSNDSAPHPIDSRPRTRSGVLARDGGPPMPSRLRDAAAAMSAGDFVGVRRALDGLSHDRSGDVAARLASYFAAALRARAGDARPDDGNLYGGAAGPEAMLDAFRALTERTPLVSFGHRTVNAAIAELALGADAIHIVDLGVGHGTQWDDLVARIGQRSKRSSLRITGVDLPAPGGDPAAVLRRTGERLESLAARCGVPLRFEAVADSIESVTATCAPRGEVLVVNAALSLHHIPGDARDRALANIASWSPARLFLIEPDADHDGLAFGARFAEAWRHYGLVFSALEATLARSLQARSVIEGAFFGREIANVVGAEGDARFERHERVERWRARLSDAGFVGEPLHGYAPGVERPFGARAVDGATALCLGARPLVAVSAWRA